MSNTHTHSLTHIFQKTETIYYRGLGEGELEILPSMIAPHLSLAAGEQTGRIFFFFKSQPTANCIYKITIEMTFEKVCQSVSSF